MNSYLGKICPYCKTEFKFGDDIVICSKCEMPHHKECWVDNGGCTTFGCNGTIQNVSGQTATSAMETEHIEATTNADGLVDMFCPRCGTKRNAEDAFCGGCGYNYLAYKDVSPLL